MITFDAMGFPIVSLPAIGLEAMLLPVTRTQFDFFLGDRTSFPQSALEEIQRLSPRKSWRTMTAAEPVGPILSAIQGSEAELFARWVGNGFRLPTDAEWRAADRAIGALGAELQTLRGGLKGTEVHPAAKAILASRLSQPHATWRSVSLFENGLLEWVKRSATAYGLQGRPRVELLRVVHNPQTHESIVPRSADRHAAFGVRLVRSRPARVS